jgi:hypothetical protein
MYKLVTILTLKQNLPHYYYKTPVALSQRVNYTDRAITACMAKLVLTFVDRGCHVVGMTYSYGRIVGFLDCSHYVFV